MFSSKDRKSSKCSWTYFFFKEFSLTDFPRNLFYRNLQVDWNVALSYECRNHVHFIYLSLPFIFASNTVQVPTQDLNEEDEKYSTTYFYVYIIYDKRKPYMQILGNLHYTKIMVKSAALCRKYSLPFLYRKTVFSSN